LTRESTAQKDIKVLVHTQKATKLIKKNSMQNKKEKR